MSKPVKTVKLTDYQYNLLRDGVSSVSEIAYLCQELAGQYSFLPGHALEAIVNRMLDVFEEVGDVDSDESEGREEEESS
jgi:hypothetical protein